MKKLILLIALGSFFQVAYSQEMKCDTICQLNNEKILCKVSNISESEVVFSYLGENLTNSLSKKQIKEIRFGSGRNQKFNELVIINGEEDWQKVQLTTLASDITGLTKKGEVKGKAMGSAMANMTKLKSRAEEQIKREAAKSGAHIVFIQMYNTEDSQPGISYGKANINGVAYSYK